MDLYTRLLKDHTNDNGSVRMRITDDGWITNDFWAVALDPQPQAFVKLFAEFNLEPLPGTYRLGRSLECVGGVAISIKGMFREGETFRPAHLLRVAGEPVRVRLPGGDACILRAAGQGLVPLRAANHDLIDAHVYGAPEIPEDPLRPVRWFFESTQTVTAYVAPMKFSEWGDLEPLCDRSEPEPAA